MSTNTKNNILCGTLVLVVGLFASTTCSAWHGGGGYHGGGYYHGGGWGWGGPVIVVGGVGYYGPVYPVACQMVEQCYPGGQCVQRQMCN